MKRIGAAALGGLLAASLLGGCVPYVDANKGTTSINIAGMEESGEKVPLKLWVTQSSQALVQGLCKEFADSTGREYTFSYTVTGPADAPDALRRDPAGADVFAFYSDALPRLAEEGLLAPAGLASLDESDPAPAEAASYQGTLYAYPAAVDGFFLYYDKSRLTGEDVCSMEAILAKDTGAEVNLAMDLTNGWYTSSFFLGAGCSLYGEKGSDPTACDFSSEAGVQAGKALLALSGNSRFASMNDEEILEGFRSGKLAAAVSGRWNADKIAAGLGDNYGCAMLPLASIGGTDKQLISYGTFLLYGVSASSTHPEEAQALAAWLASADGQRRALEALERAPTAPDLLEDTALMLPHPADDSSKAKAVARKRQTTAAIAAQGHSQVTMPSIPQMKQFWSAFEVFGEGLRDGSVTEENLQSSLDQLAASLLAEQGLD